MTDTPHSAAGGTGGGRAIEYPVAATTLNPPASGMVRLGGALGIAACSVGLAVMLAACMGLNKALVLSIIPVALSLPGLVISIVGAVFQKHQISEDTHVLHALFVNAAGLVGGMLEMAAWRNWPIFAH